MKSPDQEQIKQLSLFRDLASQQWSLVYPLLNRVRVIEAEQLICEGDRAHSFYIILNGHFMIHYKDGSAVSLNQKGDIIGWSSVVTPFQYTANVTALTDGELLCIGGAEFLELIQTDPVLGTKLLEKINESIHSRPHIGLTP